MPKQNLLKITLYYFNDMAEGKSNQFSEQIKSPLWQKRRLEILNKDLFTCQICGDKDSQLHVHHLCYDPKRKYWEYEDWELITLCDKCHSGEHNNVKREISKQINEIRSMGFTNTEILRSLYKVKWALEYGQFFTELDFIQDQDVKLSSLTQRHINNKEI